VKGGPLPFGDWELANVTTDAIEQFRDIRQASGRIGTNRNLGTLQAAFSWAASAKRKYVSESPFRDGDKPAVERFEERARTRRLQAGETEKLLAACGDHLRGVVECALETGMRRGEILTLQWNQVRSTPRPQIFLPAWNLSGHFKTGHRWTLQNRPPRAGDRDSQVLLRQLLGPQIGVDFRPPALGPAFEDVRVM
jgi:integrase